MPQQITTAFSKLVAAIREFTVAQRTLALIGLGIMVVGAIALTSWISKPQMAPLYTNLEAADAAAIVDQLTSEGVQYQLGNGGTTVLVPENQVYAQRLKIAASGMTPTSEGGYSVLDDMGMTASEFQQDVAYKRALEGELAKTLNAMAGVETASVQLALPEDSVFVSEQQPASASVFVKPKAGKSFTDDQVQAMVHLVSASIQGLPTENVAVIDANGNVLSDAMGDTTTAASNKKTLEYENRIASNVQNMLDRILGSGMAVVSVTADLDSSTTSRTSEKFDSNENAKPLTERTTSEEYVGRGTAEAGVLGPDNIAVPTTNDDEEAGNYKNTSAERTNAVDKVTETTQIGPGSVRRQSVSVAVDQTAAAAMNMADLRNMVASAAGIDEDRGDVVTVTRMAFDTQTAQAAQQAIATAQAEEKAAAQKAMIRNIAIAVAVIVLVATVSIMTARRRRESSIPDQPAPELPPLDLGELNFIEQPTNELAAAEALSQIEFPAIPELASAPDPAALMAERKRQDVVTLAEEDPEQIADYLRELMDSRG